MVKNSYIIYFIILLSTITLRPYPYNVNKVEIPNDLVSDFSKGIREEISSKIKDLKALGVGTRHRRNVRFSANSQRDMANSR